MHTTFFVLFYSHKVISLYFTLWNLCKYFCKYPRMQQYVIFKVLKEYCIPKEEEDMQTVHVHHTCGLLISLRLGFWEFNMMSLINITWLDNLDCFLCWLLLRPSICKWMKGFRRIQVVTSEVSISDRILEYAP
jgi:hypothetical protein